MSFSKKSKSLKVVGVLVALFSLTSLCHTQENVTIDGAVKLSASTVSTPENGTIQWNGADFQGRTAAGWLSLTNGGSSSGSNTSAYEGEFVNLLFHNNTDTVHVFNDRLNVWSTVELTFTIGTTNSLIYDTFGNFLIVNTSSPTVHIYNSELNAWNQKTFSHTIENSNLTEAFTGNFMIRENNDDYHVYIADTNAWLPAKRVSPRLTAPAQKRSSLSDDWK